MLLTIERSRNSALIDHCNLILNEIISSNYDYLTIGNFVENNDNWYSFIDGLKEAGNDERYELIESYFYDYMLPSKKYELIEYLYSEITNYLEMNEHEFNCLIEDLDGWNGYLYDDRWMEMEWLDDEALLGDYTPFELLEMGMRSKGDFYTSDKYFRFTVYGTLESTSEKEYMDYLSDSFIDDVLENYQHLDIPSGLDNMLIDLERVKEVE